MRAETRHDEAVRWVAISMLVHALVIAWLAGRSSERLTEWHMPTLPTVAHAETETLVELLDPQAGGGGSPAMATPMVAARRAPLRSPDAWEQIDVHVESARLSGDGDGGSGGGDGGGVGGGHGAGFGLGNGGGVRVPDGVPAPPAPPPDPPVSKARPAKLIWPTRDEEVEDDASLFVATVTVDANGDVVGAHMKTMRPGAKSDRAANAIWTFRYAPALDDDGKPTRSTFEQPFQIR